MKTIGVVGAGTIGTGVAQCLAAAGYHTLLVDTQSHALEAAMRHIEEGLRLGALFGSQQPVQAHAIANVETSTILSKLESADFVIENITEDWALKSELYRALDSICPSNAIFAANTSVLSITRLAALTKRPEKVLGLHFMNPVPLKPTVELIKGIHTNQESVRTTERLLASMEKSAIVVRDFPGFVSNRVLMLMINEAIGTLHDGVADADAIDRIFRECMAHKMGPLQTADLIGLDTILLSVEGLFAAYGDPKYRPHPLLQQMVAAGLLGRKSGRGFYEYPTDLR